MTQTYFLAHMMHYACATQSAQLSDSSDSSDSRAGAAGSAKGHGAGEEEKEEKEEAFPFPADSLALCVFLCPQLCSATFVADYYSDALLDSQKARARPHQPPSFQFSSPAAALPAFLLACLLAD